MKNSNVDKFGFIRDFENNEWPKLGVSPDVHMPSKYVFYELCESTILDRKIINVDAITGHNASEGNEKVEFYANKSRVIRSISYILNISQNEEVVEPLTIHRIKNDDSEDYYIKNGKHRFYAHLLLNLNQVPVEISDYSSYFKEVKNSSLEYNQMAEQFVVKWNGDVGREYSIHTGSYTSAMEMLRPLIRYGIVITDSAKEAIKAIIFGSKEA